jgi:hypothetical protein
VGAGFAKIVAPSNYKERLDNGGPDPHDETNPTGGVRAHTGETDYETEHEGQAVGDDRDQKGHQEIFLPVPTAFHGE